MPCNCDSCLLRDRDVRPAVRVLLLVPAEAARPGRLRRAVSSTERTAIVGALAMADGNKTAAARLLGIGRPNLYAKMRALGLR